MIAADLEDINNNKSNNSNGDHQEKRTVGEELFLVHLNRASAVQPDPTDFDRETKAKEGALSPSATKTMSKSKAAKPSNDQDLPTPGEELWKVHCKRFKGSDDGEDDVEADGKLDGVKGASGLIGGRGGSVAHDDGRVLHLRNRDVAIH